MRILHLIGIASLLVVSGLVHGKWTHRWSGGEAQVGKDLLSGLEEQVGDWQPGELLTINPADIPPKTKTTSRQFLPLRGGKAVVVSVSSGHPGEVAVHTPDVCYLGVGYQLKSAVTRQTVKLKSGGEASFWMADFEKVTASGSDTVRVRWSWTTDGNWQAPDSPRFQYALAPVLYKLYIVHNVVEDDDLTREDPYRTLSADLATALNRQLNSTNPQ